MTDVTNLGLHVGLGPLTSEVSKEVTNSFATS